MWGYNFFKMSEFNLDPNEDKKLKIATALANTISSQYYVSDVFGRRLVFYWADVLAAGANEAESPDQVDTDILFRRAIDPNLN